MDMALPTTPKANFATPKRIKYTRTAYNENQENFVAPSTPKTQNATPKTCKFVAPSTPECFNAVTFETPNRMSRRRSSHNKLDEDSNLTVAVRIRPMNSRELACVGSADVVRVKDQELVIRSSPLGNSSMSLDHVFQYDHIFWSCDETKKLYASQEEVFLSIGKPLLTSAFRGYNACLFAYGQTGSGKSYSMMGPSTCEITDIDSEEFSGVIPRFCRELFERISNLSKNFSVSVEVSYFEIYNEKIHDLLAIPSSTNRVALKVREHPELGPYVVDLSVHSVKTYKELRTWLIIGNKNRATAATCMNENSSRSHSIFSIELNITDCLEESDMGRRSKVSLVDLAGSERLGGSHNSDEKIRQGVSINKSLLTLGKVISALADQKKNQFVPYRDSVLTWLLKESLGGNSLTCMLATITPANSNLEETLSTLRYACQARTIVNRARINENPHDKLIRELKSEVQRLKALKQDYERNTLLNSSLNNMSNGTLEELEDLRCKLTDAEGKLLHAETNWKQRFMECTAIQLKELAESEKRREELESEIRVMKTSDPKIDISLYKTSFLQELQSVLAEDDVDKSNVIEKISEWCDQNQFHWWSSSSTVTIIDFSNNRQKQVSLEAVQKLSNWKNLGNYIRAQSWTALEKKNLNKSEVRSSLNQVYKILHFLKPTESDNNLNLLFAKVNKSLQAFETALLHTVAKNGNKTVSFNV